MSISNFCHGTNYYHLVQLYDAPEIYPMNIPTKGALKK